ncbi:MAG: DUF1816 domain-containing protein [Cyanobacteria bacterium P01_F01_bin.150]
MVNIWLNVLQTLGKAWWIEVKTDDCTYFFGPFASQNDALASQAGYLEDLEQDGESNIQATLMQGKPGQLTIEAASEKTSKNSAIMA